MTTGKIIHLKRWLYSLTVLKYSLSTITSIVFYHLQDDSDALVRTLSLRVARELIKSRPPGVTQFTEQLTGLALECYKETDCNVSQAAEDLFSPLASALPPQRVLDILIPIVSKGADTNSLGALKLISKVKALQYAVVTKL